MARSTERKVICTCNRCNESADTERKIVHREWCGVRWMVDARGMMHPQLELRTIRWTVVEM